MLEAFRVDLEGAFQELELLEAILKENGYRITRSGSLKCC